MGSSRLFFLLKFIGAMLYIDQEPVETAPTSAKLENCNCYSKARNVVAETFVFTVITFDFERQIYNFAG